MRKKRFDGDLVTGISWNLKGLCRCLAIYGWGNIFGYPSYSAITDFLEYWIKFLRRREGFMTELVYNPTVDDNTIDQSNDGIYFCDEGNSTQKIGRQDLSPQKKQAIRELHTLDKRWNFVVVLHYTIWLAAAWVAVRSDYLAIDLLAYTIAGFSLSTLSVLGHESSHNLITRNPKIDRWIGFICGLPIMFSAMGYRILHPMHHKFLHSKEDPDDIENVTRDSKFLTALYVFLFVFGVYLYLIMLPINGMRKGKKLEKVSVLVEWIAMIAIVTSAWMMLPTQVMVEGWLLPLLVAGQVANLRGIAEHGMTTGGNEFTDTRTVATHPVISFMMCNINYHLEHHLYPGIPWYNLPKLHALLQEEYVAAGSSVYKSYTTFLWDVIKALRAGVVAGSRVIPAHIRDEVCL